MGSNETITQAATAGLGVALIFLYAITDQAHQGRLALLQAPGLPIERQWFLVRPVIAVGNPAAVRIAAEIAGLKGSFLPSELRLVQIEVQNQSAGISSTLNNPRLQIRNKGTPRRKML